MEVSAVAPPLADCSPLFLRRPPVYLGGRVLRPQATPRRELCAPHTEVQAVGPALAGCSPRYRGRLLVHLGSWGYRGTDVSTVAVYAKHHGLERALGGVRVDTYPLREWGVG
jgi:hypothetical protein